MVGFNTEAIPIKPFQLTSSIRYLRVVNESEVIVRDLYALLQLLDEFQASGNHRHVLGDRRVTWKTNKQQMSSQKCKLIANSLVMLSVNNEDEHWTLGFLCLHLLLEDHHATFQLLVKHFDQHPISSVSIGCYQGSLQQSAKHVQNLPNTDSLKLCCVYCISETQMLSTHYIQRRTL